MLLLHIIYISYILKKISEKTKLQKWLQLERQLQKLFGDLKQAWKEQIRRITWHSNWSYELEEF